MSTTSEQYLRKQVRSLYDRIVFGTIILDRTMSVAAAFAFDCGRFGLERAGREHIEALEALAAQETAENEEAVKALAAEEKP